MEADFRHIHSEIISRCKRGDRHAQFQLYQLYAKSMLNVSIRILGNQQEAEDILQEAFIDMFGKLQTFREESTFGAWFKRIVINKSINAVKKKRLVISEEEISESGVEMEDVIEEEREVNHTINDVQKALGQLPDGYRLVFTLYALEGLSHKEVSEELGISESTSKSQYNRSKNKLKELLTLS